MYSKTKGERYASYCSSNILRLCHHLLPTNSARNASITPKILQAIVTLSVELRPPPPPVPPVPEPLAPAAGTVSVECIVIGWIGVIEVIVAYFCVSTLIPLCKAHLHHHSPVPQVLTRPLSSEATHSCLSIISTNPTWRLRC